VSSLKDRCQFSDAAKILNDHLGDVEECIAVLVQGRLWNEAVWSSYHHKRADMIGKYIMGNLVFIQVTKHRERNVLESMMGWTCSSG
jgi:hypothetical protein